MFKFKNLWRNGQEATLNLRTKAGKASLELCVELGAAVGLPSHHHRLHHGGDSVTSRDRRRVRRAAERSNTGLKVSEEGTKDNDTAELMNKAEKAENIEDDVVKNLNVAQDDFVGKTSEDNTHDAEKAETNGRKSRSDSIENNLDVAEEASKEASKEDQEDTEPCESCKGVFAFHKDIQNSMCDK